MNIVKTQLKEWWELSMKWKLLTSTAILWPVFFIWVLGCGTISESYINSVDNYSKTLIKDYKKQLQDPYNPIWYEREKKRRWFSWKA